MASPPCEGTGLFDRDAAQGRLDSSADRLRITDRPEMHEEEPRLLREHVAVQRRDGDVVRAQLRPTDYEFKKRANLSESSPDCEIYGLL